MCVHLNKFSKNNFERFVLGIQFFFFAFFQKYAILYEFWRDEKKINKHNK